ncbi:hypothetical protein KUTeg_003807, partial [Tegillarca granosa]
MLDFTRGSRGKDKSSRTLLLPLLKEFSGIVKVHLYHTPDLRGFLQKILPEKYNETIGLNHIKMYLFDDSFIISGANLSDSYFTNRQDRYILFDNCKEVADFFTDMIKTVSSFSFTLDSNNEVNISDTSSIHPYKDKSCVGSENKTQQREINLNHCDNHSEDFEDSRGDIDTWIYPLIQMGPFDISDDEVITKQIFELTDKNDKIYLASGYFNLTNDYMDTIVKKSTAEYDVLLASPEVNGFFGARFPLGMIPTSYIYIAEEFFKEVNDFNQQHRIILREYFRDHWTFHAKGIWYYLPGDRLPEHQRIYERSETVTDETFKREDRHIP